MFPLKPFQERAVAELKDHFLGLWSMPSDQLPLVFKSPTGSGKTVMLAQFLRDLVGDPRFAGNDVAFLWMSKGPSLVEQSRAKLFEYYGGASELVLLGTENLDGRAIPRNGVFFVNWEKLKGHSREVLKLRRDDEREVSFDRMIEETHEAGRRIVVIIDEEHLGADTEKALELIGGLIRPKVIIRASATPKYEPTHSDVVSRRAGSVEVPRAAVVGEGLIKEKIVFQTEEDLAQKRFKGMDQTEILLELAYRKREELLAAYRAIGVDINPLVLVQLPNDDVATAETRGGTLREIVEGYLKGKGVPASAVAVWLSEDKVNLEQVERANSPVSFLLFKQAAATGWDCPRAGVLVMFREIKNPTFAIQTVGRILRMPLGTHFAKPELNLGYLYTNYKRNEVISEYGKNKAENKPAIFGSYRKDGLAPIALDSVFMSRTDYNDLGDSFQQTFREAADRAFGIKGKDAKKQLAAHNLNLAGSVTNGIIVGVEIDDYDNFTKELLAEGGSHEQEMSQHDVERLYNLVCFNLIGRQTDEAKKFAPERSWGKLKSALNVWLLPLLGGDRDHAYRVILADLLADSSALRPVIGAALAAYRPIREEEVDRKSSRKRRTETVEIPRESLFFTEDYEEVKAKRAAMAPAYVAKDAPENERAFLRFLDGCGDVEWWYKNGDAGSEHFSVAYRDPDDGKERLFYPDWIVKAAGKVWVLETKDGITAAIPDTARKAEALHGWLKGRSGFVGGIVTKGPDGWMIHDGPAYSYAPSLRGWKVLPLR